jgi:hypothetical protein
MNNRKLFAFGILFFMCPLFGMMGKHKLASSQSFKAARGDTWGKARKAAFDRLRRGHPMLEHSTLKGESLRLQNEFYSSDYKNLPAKQLSAYIEILKRVPNETEILQYYADHHKMIQDQQSHVSEIEQSMIIDPRSPVSDIERSRIASRSRSSDSDIEKLMTVSSPRSIVTHYLMNRSFPLGVDGGGSDDNKYCAQVRGAIKSCLNKYVVPGGIEWKAVLAEEVMRQNQEDYLSFHQQLLNDMEKAKNNNNYPKIAICSEKSRATRCLGIDFKKND